MMDEGNQWLLADKLSFIRQYLDFVNIIGEYARMRTSSKYPSRNRIWPLSPNGGELSLVYLKVHRTINTTFELLLSHFFSHEIHSKFCGFSLWYWYLLLCVRDTMNLISLLKCGWNILSLHHSVLILPISGGSPLNELFDKSRTERCNWHASTG